MTFQTIGLMTLQFFILFSALCSWNGISNGATLQFAIIVDKNRTDLVAAVDLAILDINNDKGILNGHTVTAQKFATDGINRFAIIQEMCNASTFVNYDAVIDVTTRNGRCASLSIAQALDAGFMSAHRELCYKTSLPSVHFNNDVYFRAMALVALEQNASREAIAVFYDDSFDIGALIPMEKVKYVPTYMYKIPTTDALIRALLTSVKSNTPASEFIIASTAEVADRILNQAASLQLITNILHWFVVTRDLNSLTCAKCGNNQVIHVKLKPRDTATLTRIQNAISNWKTLSYKRLDSIYAYEAVRGAAKVLSSLTNPESGSPSFVCYKPSNLTLNRYTKFITKMKALPLYNGVIAPIHFNQTLVSKPLTLAVSVCTSSACVESDTTYSSVSDSLTSNITLSYKPRQVLQVIAMEEHPFVYKNKNGTYEGYSVSCLKYIAKRLHFDYVIRDPAEMKYGVRQADGSFNGMIGEVAAGKADMAIGGFTITAERESVVDMTIPYYDYAGLQILMARKSTTNNSMFYFITVFTLYVWLSIGGTLVITGLLVTVFDKLSPYSFQNKTEWAEGEPEGKIFTIKESMWFVLGAYTMAGESFDPRATSTRMLVAGFWIFSFIMYAMYTANLAASLTVSKLTASINSVRELSAQTDIKYTVISDAMGHTFFSRMKDIEENFFKIWKDLSIGDEALASKISKYSVWEYPIEERYTDMYNRMFKWGLAKNTEQLLSKVKNDGWAAFMETPFIKFYKGRDCSLYSVGEILSSRPYGLVLRNKSPLTRQVNLIILEMQRDRIMEDYKVYWWDRNKKSCPVQQDSGGIKLDQLGGVFIFLACGVACGTIVLGIEFIVVKVFGKERFMPDEMDTMTMGGVRPVASAAPHVSMRLQSARPRSRSASVVPPKQTETSLNGAQLDSNVLDTSQCVSHINETDGLPNIRLTKPTNNYS